jgi:hypothetical protein
LDFRGRPADLSTLLEPLFQASSVGCSQVWGMFSEFSYHIAYQPVNNFVIANFMFLEETFFLTLTQFSFCKRVVLSVAHRTTAERTLPSKHETEPGLVIGNSAGYEGRRENHSAR